MVDLSGHEAGNGGYSQRKPTAHRDSSTRKLVLRPDNVNYVAVGEIIQLDFGGHSRANPSAVCFFDHRLPDELGNLSAPNTL